MAVALTKEVVLVALKQVHGDAFNYDDLEFKNTRSDIKIYCNKHKDYFYQRYDLHLKSKGCPVCAKNEQIKSVFERCKKAHNNKYDYSNSVYISSNELMEVICPDHGSFMIAPKKHWAGRGCPKCSKGEKLKPVALREKLIKVHKGRYSYASEKEFVIGEDHKISITCSEHGVFKQNVYKHASGQGCPQCAREDVRKSQTLDQGEFIQACKEKHGEFYDYSKTIYKKHNLPITVGCPKHGEFEIEAYSHKKGADCPKCHKLEKTSKRSAQIRQYWLKKFENTYGNMYNYDKAVIIHKDKPIEIVCSEHKSFFMSPSHHSRGYGCPTCRGTKLRVTQEEFITRAREVFGLTYDYSDTVYSKMDLPVTVKCRKHGYFDVLARSHVAGHGCLQCATEAKRKTLDVLIGEFVAVHGYYYNYDKVVYLNNMSLIKIGCPKHGNFTQRVYAHKRGSTCPKCRDRNTE